MVNMGEWKEVRLGEMVDIVAGYSYNSKELVNHSNKVLVTLKNFGIDGNFQIRGFKPFDGSPKIEQKVKIGDLIVAHTDLTQNASVLGNPTLIPENTNFNEMYITMDLVKVIPQPNHIDKKFLYFLMKTKKFKWHCISQANGTTVLHLPKKAALSFKTFIPPLPEQRAIAEVLSSLDDKIDLLHRQNKMLEQMAEALFRQWFIEEAKEDWEEKPLSYFGEIICGKTPSKKKKEFYGGEIPFIKIPDMHGKMFIFSTTENIATK